MDVFAEEAVQAQHTIDLYAALLEGLHKFGEAPIQLPSSSAQPQMSPEAPVQRQLDLDQINTNQTLASALSHLTLFVSATCPRLENTDLAWQMRVLEDWRACILNMFQPATADWLQQPVAINADDYVLNTTAYPRNDGDLTSSSESLGSNDDTEICSNPWSTTSDEDVSIEWQLALSEIYVNEYEDLIFQLVFSATTDMHAEMAQLLTEVTTHHAFDLTRHKHLVFHHNMLIVRPSDD